ncbi:sulfite exporter TauE/SafE family protein [Sulfitobacter donghicola]|uniref:Probable membrane transporter protein n=1 Tax=Sulfitobacter donghicola DSW-25 = KCTC 12864 = JCM 14565 TaxID=1300350 RepID=A0A073IID9_9RHOB|nr:sulfite exporter TauE/SafE family protein [Sulfitobacter donghicola]KEJ90083.1 membrane protein [Sulfitobacter donghicola DSW-25 = KCTC 12864 = JCM 14565]KIN66770.1 Membrane protein [Sulfitobacter donghicola DSW-25 = KCTC 12864 = JCM 14565]
MPETMLLIQMAVLLLVIGAFAGVLAGLLGVGGGIVLVPAFFYAFQTLGYGGDQLMQMCLATSLATIIVTSVRSVMSHHKKGAVDWGILKSWAPGIVVGAIVGMFVVAGLRSTTLQAIFGVLALVVGLYMGFGRSEWRLGQAMPMGLLRAVLSPLMGFLSVLMGIGGGSFGVPMMSLYNTPIHRAVATAAGFGVVIAVPSVIGFLFVDLDPAKKPPLTIGAVNLGAFVLVIAMTLLTAPLGARLAHAMDPKPLKRVFAVFLVLVALNMLRKAFWG